MEVLKFTPDEISSMVNRYKQSKKTGYEMQFSTAETNKQDNKLTLLHKVQVSYHICHCG